MPKVGGQDRGKANPIVDGEGSPVKGLENRAKALAVWQETIARDKAGTRGLGNPVCVICEEFLDYTQRHREEDTSKDYRRTLQSFKDKWPKRWCPVSIAEPHHLFKTA